MASNNPSSRCVLRTLIIPIIIGVFSLASVWPLYEASQRYRDGEEVLFGPIPSHEQRIAFELQMIAETEEEPSLQAAAHIVTGLTALIESELQSPPDEADANASEVIQQRSKALDQAVDTVVADLRELKAVVAKISDAGETIEEEQAADVQEAADATKSHDVFIDLFKKNINALAQAQDEPSQFTLRNAILQQVNLTLTPLREQRAAELEELGEEPSVAVEVIIRQQLSELWKPSSVISNLVIIGLLAIFSLAFLALSVLRRQHKWKNLLRSHSCAHVTLAVWVMVASSAISLATRPLFEDGDDGWALTLIGHILYYVWPILVLWFSLACSHLYAARGVCARKLDASFQGLGHGDRFLESLRSGGEDPNYAAATKQSIGVHLAVIIGPIMLSLIPGCWGRDSYKLPSGSGEPAAAVMVQVVEEEQQKEELVLAEDSPIIFERATLEDSDAMQKLVQESKQTYEASASGAAGAMGVGGGEEGGFLGEGGPIRFIRIRHRGAGWDDGMHSAENGGNADANFLRWLSRAASLETETVGEAMTIQQIYNRFPKGERPPFVYLTGKSLKFTQEERETLRKLCLEGTLLFADSESTRFTRDFQNEMRRVFSDRKLLLINDEDPIMRIPNVFPDGLRSNQWHGGNQAMGIRHKRQLVVFFHPGDCNDLWKDNANLVPREIRDTALWIGQNIVYYSFKRYTERYKGGRGQ